jgi:hypothetical protein
VVVQIQITATPSIQRTMSMTSPDRIRTTNYRRQDTKIVDEFRGGIGDVRLVWT